MIKLVLHHSFSLKVPLFTLEVVLTLPDRTYQCIQVDVCPLNFLSLAFPLGPAVSFNHWPTQNIQVLLPKSSEINLFCNLHISCSTTGGQYKQQFRTPKCQRQEDKNSEIVSHHRVYLSIQPNGPNRWNLIIVTYRKQRHTFNKDP